MRASSNCPSLNTCRRLLAGIAVATAITAPVTTLHAQEPFIAEVLWTAATFCPRSYMEANGQLLPIAQNTALFALIGTTYGGDGLNTFALPDLRGRSMIHAGSGPGLAPRTQGESGGTESVKLTISELPAHSHALIASSGAGASADPTNGVLARPSATATTTTTATGTGSITTEGRGRNGVPTTTPVDLALDVDVDVAVDVATYDNPGTANVKMAAESIEESGDSKPLAIRSPFQTLRACIATQGIFPGRDN